MNRKTMEVFHALMKNGWIDRRENPIMWSYAEDAEIREEFEDIKAVMGVDLFRAGDRLYMLPTQDNDLFLKNNQDYRRDIKADNSVRTRDLYLLNYLSIYVIYLFFGGEGKNPLCREFISKEDLISLFTDHCKTVEKASDEEAENDYSENFTALAKAWLGKTDGETASQKFDHRFGIVNRILNKYKADVLFEVGEDDLIRPTRKMKDLMPYFLRKERIAEIQNWIREEEANAQDQ